ncbi:hypothetical protein BOTBODRAFT_557546 [Botryobasidium botryosum FD-172 SS1]|uniref:Protein kinase domain-containing protein n=1 Tax=Botryobasidium botryosum (strain FD-172 SS1) TaxID=930990 RepID=A0A067M2I3_BOTB1|nr:hypothetical protein BOTBODRAFT_557546 [Botryobasidium botryosum FD-172 SS1]
MSASTSASPAIETIPFPPDKPTVLASPIPPSIGGASDDEEDEGDAEGVDDSDSDDESEDDDDDSEDDSYYHVPGKTMKERRKNKNASHKVELPPDLDLDLPLYKPHGRWAWTYNKPIDDTETIKQIGYGAQAEVYFKTGRVDRTTFDYIAKCWNVWNEWRGFYSELYLYSSSKHLRQLQGVCVPWVIGVHSVLGGIVSVAMEPCHPVAWTEAHRNMTRKRKDAVVEAFRRIHAMGVLHNDVELRHILITPEDQVFVIDFQESKSLNPCADVELGRCTQEELDNEMIRVKNMIGYWDKTKEYDPTKPTGHTFYVPTDEHRAKIREEKRKNDEEFGFAAAQARSKKAAKEKLRAEGKEVSPSPEPVSLSAPAYAAQ